MKTALITGSSAGFGQACARALASQGARLVLCGRRSDRLFSLAEELQLIAPVLPCAFDIRDRQATEDALSALPSEFAEIDILINNAGLALGIEPANECEIEDWECMVDTNIKGLLYCTRLLLPGMLARNSGHIINIGSISGTWPYRGGNVYGATKAFVAQFSRNLRSDLLGSALRVTNIAPGMAESEFSVVRFKGDTEKAADIYKNCEPLQPEDIASIVVWVTSQPPHVNVNSIEVMPTCQAWGGMSVHRSD